MRAQLLILYAALALHSPHAALAWQADRHPESKQEHAVSKEFEEKVKAYITLQKKLEGELPGLKSTEDAAEIAAHQRALSAKIMEARKASMQGELFTPAVTTQFREIIRRTFQEPGGQSVRRTVTEGDAPKPIPVKVNVLYPADSPVHTTPPTLLNRLPALPMELAYRIVGRTFVLLDNKTNLIVDFIPDAVP